MKYEFSTAISSFCAITGLSSAMAQVKAAGYDSFDFPFSVYSVGFQAPMVQQDWRSFLRSVKELCRQLDLPVSQGHAPWLQDIPSDFRYVSPDELYHRCIEAAAYLGCKHLIFHPVRLRERIDSLSLKERIHDWNVRWFHELVRTAENYDVYINLENTFDSHFVQKAGDPSYPYTTGEDMLRLLRDIGSDRIRLCLDTGHANNSHRDIPAMIYSMKGELATLHLNDNFGLKEGSFSDIHLFPGKGQISWAPIMKALQDISYKGIYNIEPIDSLPRADDGERIRLLAHGREKLKEMLSLQQV